MPCKKLIPIVCSPSNFEKFMKLEHAKTLIDLAVWFLKKSAKETIKEYTVISKVKQPLNML